MKCYKCNKLGHIRRNFPERGDNKEFAQRTQENDISDSASDTKENSDCDICLMVREVSVAEKTTGSTIVITRVTWDQVGCDAQISSM